MKELARFAYEAGGERTGSIELGLETSVVTTSRVPREALQIGHVQNYLTYGNGADICLVEIDQETYNLKVLRYVTVHDCGKIFDRQIVEGQMHGALMNGFEAALLSKSEYSSDGQVLTQTFMDYLLATSPDSSECGGRSHRNTFSLQQSWNEGGWGKRSRGPLAAIPNAVGDALHELNIHIEKLPVTPDPIYKVLSQKEKRRQLNEGFDKADLWQISR